MQEWHLYGLLAAKGGKVLVCAHCARIMKVDKDRLAPGIVLSDHDDIVKALQPGMVGFSY
jgi:hypothetical protein